MNVAFVPKRAQGKTPWITFGCNNGKDYDRWIGHVCGICCLKMIGDTHGLTKHMSLFELTQRCLQLGGFKIMPDNTIQGVYHHPLLALARDLGLDGRVVGHLDLDAVIEAVDRRRYVILSIDLERVKEGLTGSHLILVHSYALESDVFLVHDCSSILGHPGLNVKIRSENLREVSNKKGLVLWPKNAR